MLPSWGAAMDRKALDEARDEPAKARPKGSLPHLPERDAPLSEWRGWLTRALNPPDGYAFDNFERHGRRLSDPAYVVLTTPAGGEVRYRFPEQRGLAKSANLRSSVVSITDGLLRMGALTAPETSDVWVALCSVGAVIAQQDEVEEFRDHLDAFMRIADAETRYTLESTGRYDALLALQARGLFERRHAQLMASEVDETKWSKRPVVLFDRETRRQWVRVPELATYLRHVVGMQLGHGTLDGLMSEVGAPRIRHEVRNGAAHPHSSFYRLAQSPGPPQSPDFIREK